MVTDILYALKRLAIENKISPKRFPAFALSKSFVSITNIFGRSYEPGLIMLYFLRTNPFKLLGMMPLFIKLAAKGRIGFLPHKIKSAKKFSRILKEAEVMENIVPLQ